MLKITSVILDRDGVINHDSKHYIKTPEEFILIDNSIDAISDLKCNDVNVFIATNQSGINRGLYNLRTFLKINDKLIRNLNKPDDILAIYYCPHTPDDNCNCRKPQTGMIDKIKTNHNIELSTTAFVGDSLRDLQAGYMAGCKFLFLVKTGKGLDTLKNHKLELNNFEKLSQTGEISLFKVFDNLYDCANYIINNHL